MNNARRFILNVHNKNNNKYGMLYILNHSWKRKSVNKNNIYVRSNICRQFSGVAKKYNELLMDKTLSPDEAQAFAIENLEKLSFKMCKFEHEKVLYEQKLNEYAVEIKKLENNSSDNKTATGNFNKGGQVVQLLPPSPPRHPRGLYLHGSVGTGKSICMDLFYNACPVVKKRRVHFHDFMSEIHERIHTWKTLKYEESKKSNNNDKKNNLQLGKIDLSPESDAILQVGLDISNEALLLCFDEFQVTDIADALIMTKLFNTMWRNGTIVVATSNRPPNDLYENGLNRHYFLPFIKSLSKYCRVLPYKSNVDYRLLLDSNYEVEGVEDRINGFLYPITNKNEMELEQIFQGLCQKENSVTTGGSSNAYELEHNVTFASKFGRTIQIPSSYGRICKFDFDDLCRKDLGAGDYNALAQFYHTIFISNIPQMSTKLHDEARRFITCIDQFYEAKIRVIFLADTEVKQLFSSLNLHDNNNNSIVDEDTQEMVTDSSNGGIDPAEDRPIGKIRETELASVVELSFAFQRAASRLHEMTSRHYMERFNKKYTT
jgi:peroxisome-assembly ATPase